MIEALDAPRRPARVRRTSRRAWNSRLSAGHAAMLVAGVLGACCTLVALRGADHRVEVLVARADLAPGTVVSANDFHSVRVNADTAAQATLVRADAAGTLVGRVVTDRVAAGHFLSSSDVQRAGATGARRSMSFPIDRAHALDGALVAGDRVDLVAVDTHTNAASYVATNAEVLHVGGNGSHGPLTATNSRTITLAVDPTIALDIASALHGHDLTLVRATGAAALSSPNADAAAAPGA
jgi:Flp pilus assembly protein CpaB